MSRLKLRLDVPHLEGDLSSSGVVANIYGAKGGQRLVEDRQRTRNLLIPAGPSWESNPRFLHVELEPGRYVVEAILPSEEVIVAEVSVTASPSTQELRLASTVSPHEWLGWQQLAGNVREKQAKEREKSWRSFEPAGPRALRAELVSLVTPSPDGSREGSTPSALAARGFFATVSSPGDADRISGEALVLPDHAHITPLVPQSRDDSFALYVFGDDPPGPQSAGPFWPGDYRSPYFWRQYLFLRGDGLLPQVSVLPAPWMQVDLSGAAKVEVLVHWEEDAGGFSGSDQGHRLSITVRDRLVSSVISYLGAGKLPAAATVLSRARDMLFGKLVNPLAAAAGAYVLLGAGEAGQPGEHVYWHAWVRNLMNWFEWLPDGAIQHAWVTLRQGRDEESLHTARESLLEGYRRGLPFYAKGVALLRDGLTLFANDARAAGTPDDEVDEALRIVRQVALRTNMRQPFTTMLLPEGQP